MENKKLIWSFLSKQTVLNIATSKNEESYCASCFYAFDQDNKVLVFKSAVESRHIEEGLNQSIVGGTILPDKLKKAVVIGAQFQGILSREAEIITKSKAVYYKKYPFALAMDGDIFVIQLSFIKYTDNKLGFGKKIVWNK